MRIFSGGKRHTGSSRLTTGNDPATFESIPEVPEENPNQPRNITTASSNRPTLIWPFHGHSRSMSRTLSTRSHSRSQSSAQYSAKHSTKNSMGTFPRRNSRFSLRPASSILGNDIIPDYVVNFIRGETPESLARKREEQPNPQNPEFHQHKRNEYSRTASFFTSHTRMASRGRDLENATQGEGQKVSVVKKLTTGWRWGVVLNVLLSFIILLVAVVCLILAVTNRKFKKKETIIATGKCSKISSIDQGIHAALNILGFFFIAGASYVSQILVSPTRNEASFAHSEMSYLDIGIPSLRNLRGISVGRAVLSSVIVFLAISSQIIYNAILFTTKSKNECSLALNGPLLGAIAVLNILFILTISLALIRPASMEPLVTLGDAIASFLTHPDTATDGACLLTKADVTSGRWAAGEAKSKYWFTESHRWIQTPSRMRWLVWAVTMLLPAGMVAAMLSMAMVDNPKDAFVSLATHRLRYSLTSSASRFGLSIVVALPHILFVGLYFSTNAMLSVFYLSHELSQFAGEPKSLRVSGQPVGTQKASSYITLPPAISLMLFVLFAFMGFMLNRAFNLATYDNDNFVSLNPLPLVILLGLLGLILVLILGLSLRGTDFSKTEDDSKSGYPLALKEGSCSAVISARSHRSAFEGQDVAENPLRWGIVSDGAETKVGHGTFSTRPVDALSVGKAYA